MTSCIPPMFTNKNLLHTKIKSNTQNKLLNYSERSRFSASIIFSVAIIAVAIRYALPIRDGDIWFHLLYGQHFIENLTLIPDHSIFSWTPASNDTIYCTWLSDILFYLYHNFFGINGLILVRYVFIFSLLVFCLHSSYKLSIISHPVNGLVFLLASLMSYTGIIVKPEIVSFFFMTVFAWNWCFIRISDESSWKHCYIFPLILLIWVNSHGGFVFGVIFLFTATLGEFLNIRLQPDKALSPLKRKHLFLSLCVSLFTIIVTPYGINYPIQLFYFFLPSTENFSYISSIASYGSPFGLNDYFGLATVLNISILILTYLFLRNFKKIEFSSLLTNLTFIFLYTSFFRTTFYWAPIFLFSSQYYLAQNQFIPKRLSYRYSFQTLSLGTIILCSWLATTNIRQSIVMPEMFSWPGFGISTMNPVSESKFISKYYPLSRIGNTYNQGSYLLWKLWPRNKVFIDSRHFPYKEWVGEYMKIFHGNIALNNPEKFKIFIDQHNCDIWLVGYSTPEAMQWFYQSPDWKLDFYGQSGAVFVKPAVDCTKYTYTSQTLDNIKNFRTAIDILRWTMIIQDWRTAKKIITGMENNFSHPGKISLINETKLIVQQLQKENRRLIISPSQ